MGIHTQADRAFRVDTPLGEDELLLEGFSGQELISTPFRYTLELLSENDAVDPASILQQPVRVSLRLADGSDRYFHGHVSRFVQLGKSEELTSYEAEVVPWLWFLSLSRDCRVFQQKSVLEIVEEIFGEYENADYRNDCIQSYPQREYCVQYRESDLNFVSRLLEEEGIYYFFTHSEEGHQLRLVDDPGMIDPCPVQSEYEVATSAHARLDEDVVTELQWEHLVNTERVTLRDYDYLQPTNNLEASRGAHGGEVYDYPGGYAEVSEGERYANLQLEERRADQQAIRGSSTCRTLTTGFSFDLTGYYIDAANQTYLVVGAWHSARGGGYRSGNPETRYSNQFQCTPTSVPYRPPRRARKPVVQGSQTAVVTGPSSEEIHTEEHGRVKVQFHWDRLGQRDENSSCWVRVSQPWAGKAWGSVFLPRIGQEVVVDFLEGDPDRPIITGRVYNADQTPPYDLPANKTQSGVKSRSSKQGRPKDFNEIRFEDRKGSEEIRIHAEKDLTTVVENSESRKVYNSRHTSIGDDENPRPEETIESLAVHGQRLRTVYGNDGLTVLEGSKGRKIVVQDGDNVLVVEKGDNTKTVEMGDNTTKVEMGDNLTNVELGSDKKEALTSIEMKVGSNSIKIDQSGITIKGIMVKIEGTAMLQAKSPLTTVEGSGILQLKAGGIASLQGAIVTIN